MGHHPKGREAYLRNIVYHKVSSFELSVFRQWCRIMKSIPRRISDNLFMIPLIAGPYLLMDWANKYNYEYHRKKAEDFANDE